MNFQVKISEYAKADLNSAYEFYEKQAVNLEKYFFGNIISEIEMLTFYEYHRMISKKLPYTIIL